MLWSEIKAILKANDLRGRIDGELMGLQSNHIGIC